MTQIRLTAKFHHEQWFTDTSDVIQCRVRGPEISQMTVRRPSAELVDRIQTEMLHYLNHAITDEFDCAANRIKSSLRERFEHLGAAGYDAIPIVLDIIKELRKTIPQIEAEEPKRSEPR